MHEDLLHGKSFGKTLKNWKEKICMVNVNTHINSHQYINLFNLNLDTDRAGYSGFTNTNFKKIPFFFV